ncbi:RNA binding motif single stranded interacting [Fasciola hepatica]|uniref:RNA binding motif single stranded interacting n=1 Tax=Fasciola hepatica TaxID=6192 RepID=A0A2H1CWG4_FASHE|nr:RNA binding motif single stranded interacting [Fasciola hepatica]
MERINEYSRATGRKLSVKFAFENEKDKLNVFVQHLPRSDYTTEDLMELFKPYGVITSAKLLDSMKGPTGIGFVRFSSPTEAEKAIKMMNKKNLCLGENTKAVTCKLADKADAQRRNLTSEITRNKFTLTHNQNQCGAGMVPQSAHASALPTGHLTGLAQSGSLATQLLSSVPTFSLEVPGFANQSATPPTMSSGVMPNIVSGPSALVQLPYASAHPGAISTPCSNLPHRSSNPLIGPPPHTQVPGSVQSQYVANLVSAYLSSMDVQQAASKTVPTAVPSNRFPNSGAPVLFHTGNSIPAPGAPSDAQVNALPPNVQYALSYGQQSQQTMAAGGTTAVSPQVVWIAPTYPNAGTSSMFQNYGFAPAFQASTVDQVKANHESQRSTPGLVLQNNYQMDRTNIPTSPANTLTSVFQSLAINGPLEASRFPMDGSLLTESSRTWPYSKTARSMEDSTPNVEQGTTCVKQVVPVSHVFEGPTNVSFTDPSSREASNFITSSISTTLASLDHSKNTVCFGAVNLPTVECFPLVEVSAANSSEYEVFSEEKLSTVNGDVAALNAEKIAPNGFHADEKANKNESTVDHKQGPRSDADCVKAVPPPTSKNDLVEPTVPLTITTTCVKFPS